MILLYMLFTPNNTTKLCFCYVKKITQRKRNFIDILLMKSCFHCLLFISHFTQRKYDSVMYFL